MDNPCRLGALPAISVHMAHNVMAYFLLSCLCHIVIDIIGMSLQFLNLFIGNNRLSVLGKS